MAADIDSVIAVGMNRTDPAGAAAAVAVATRASGKPVVVYPNSGETWNAAERRWFGSPGFSADQVATWTASGARLVGGCCRVGPRDIAQIVGALSALSK